MSAFFSVISLSYTLFFAFLTIIFFIHNVYALPKEAILLLKDESRGACGSGFALDQQHIVTAGHVAESLCLGGECRDIFVNGKQISLKVKTILSSFDLALLEVPQDFKLTSIGVNIETPKVEEKVAALGFPLCGEFQQSEGKILSINGNSFYTTARGKKGSSGSGIFNADGALIGVVTAASTVTGALLSQTFDLEFSDKGVAIKDLLPLLTAPISQSLIAEAQKIEGFYWQEVFPVLGTKRLWQSMELFSKISSFKRRISESKVATEGLALINDNLPPIPPPPTVDTELGYSADVLSLISSLERFGVSRKALVIDSPNALITLIEKSGRQQAQITKLSDIVKKFSSKNYPGYELMLFSSITLLILIGVIVLPFWGYTMGHVWHVVKGGFFKKLWWTFWISFLLWPLSYFAFLIGQRRKKVIPLN